MDLNKSHIMQMTLEEELKEAKETLAKEEYKLRWGGYTNPYQYITSAQYTVTRYWSDKVKALEEKSKNTEIEWII